MTTIEKPTTNIPTPAAMAEITPSLTKANMVEVDPVDMSRPTLGQIATREEYRAEGAAPLDPTQFDRTAEANKATLDAATDDEKVQDELAGGFTIHDSTQPEAAIDEDHDELPADLKDQLGEPDDDEVHEQ